MGSFFLKAYILLKEELSNMISVQKKHLSSMARELF